MIVLKNDITLREVVVGDAETIWKSLDAHRKYFSVWLSFVTQMKSPRDEEEYLASVLSVPYPQRNLIFAIERGGNLCGLVGFVGTDTNNHRAEIGYWLLPEYQGQGIMTSCVRYLCRWSVSERAMNSIRIRCAVGNASSNGVPRRLGFSLEGVEREGELLSSGRYTDINVYSILASEVSLWPQEETLDVQK